MSLSLKRLKEMMISNGVEQLYLKKLSPNDNSKNQIYLGGNYSSLNVLPVKEIYTDGGKKAGSIRDRYKANLNFYWIDKNGIYFAKNAQLILYPKYPEVRLSGFLLGCKNAPSHLLRVRDEGRIMFFGITKDGRLICYVASPDSDIAREIASAKEPEMIGVFQKVPLSKTDDNSKQILLAKLLAIHQKDWIDSWRLSKTGHRLPCESPNCGGCTLEAEFGISANGYAEPDFMGWEIKQYGVTKLENIYSGGPVTLMTPEPTKGIYKDKGVDFFIRKFGYKDKLGREDRFNFGGVHKFNSVTPSTGLKMILDGYDDKSGKIIKPDGGLTLISKKDEIAAVWTFADLMAHWNKKHAKAVYVPSLSRKSPGRQYKYGDNVRIAEGTDFNLFLSAIAKGVIYYDPGIKLEGASSAKPKIKKRSQFRVKNKNLNTLYKKVDIELLD